MYLRRYFLSDVLFRRESGIGKFFGSDSFLWRRHAHHQGDVRRENDDNRYGQYAAVYQQYKDDFGNCDDRLCRRRNSSTEENKGFRRCRWGRQDGAKVTSVDPTGDDAISGEDISGNSSAEQDPGAADGSKVMETKRGVYEMVPLDENTDVKSYLQAPWSSEIRDVSAENRRECGIFLDV